MSSISYSDHWTALCILVYSLISLCTKIAECLQFLVSRHLEKKHSLCPKCTTLPVIISTSTAKLLQSLSIGTQSENVHVPTHPRTPHAHNSQFIHTFCFSIISTCSKQQQHSLSCSKRECMALDSRKRKGRSGSLNPREHDSEYHRGNETVAIVRAGDEWIMRKSACHILCWNSSHLSIPLFWLTSCRWIHSWKHASAFFAPLSTFQSFPHFRLPRTPPVSEKIVNSMKRCHPTTATYTLVVRVIEGEFPAHCHSSYMPTYKKVNLFIHSRPRHANSLHVLRHEAQVYRGRGEVEQLPTFHKVSH